MPQAVGNTTSNLIIRLDGSDIDNGIDLFELAPALLALGNTIKTANEILVPERREIGVNVRPFQRGSFIVDIALFAQTNVQQILDFTSRQNVQQIKEVLEWIGLISGAGVSLVGLVKWLKGKPPKQIEKLESGDLKYTNFEDNSVTVNMNVDTLYQNETIHQHFYTAYGKLLEKDGIDSYQSYLKDDEDNPVSNTKEDLEAFRGYSEGELNVLADEESESEYTTHLNFKRGSYEGQSDNWSFRKGNMILNATIKDQSFLDKIQSGEIRPFSKDLLKVRLKEKRKIKGTELLTPVYEILEVLEYKSADRASNTTSSMFEE